VNKWKDNDLEKVKVTIEIPKNTVAFIVNTISNNNGVIAMSNTQYDSEDIKKLVKDSDD
jgi:acetylornithine/succinyldiaminopimelate/putrescine aminotransferase